jgi:hypothetical protein
MRNPRQTGEVLGRCAVSVNFLDLVMMSGSYQFRALPFIPATSAGASPRSAMA